ncbi:hypothetical protein D3C78_1674640 [compost metagenome]
MQCLFTDTDHLLRSQLGNVADRLFSQRPGLWPWHVGIGGRRRIPAQELQTPFVIAQPVHIQPAGTLAASNPLGKQIGEDHILLILKTHRRQKCGQTTGNHRHTRC